MKENQFSELASLFFSTKQIMKKQMPTNAHSDPNSWLRFETMKFIDVSGEPTMRDIAEYLRIKAPSATSLIAHLASLGLIVRKVEKDDKRIVRIALSPKGAKEVDAYTKRSIVTMRKTFSKLDAKEIQTLVTILKHLRAAHLK